MLGHTIETVMYQNALCDDEVHKLQSLSDVIRMIKARHLACLGEKRNAQGFGWKN
jgi:hypothetical protein